MVPLKGDVGIPDRKVISPRVVLEFADCKPFNVCPNVS